MLSRKLSGDAWRSRLITCVVLATGDDTCPSHMSAPRMRSGASADTPLAATFDEWRCYSDERCACPGTTAYMSAAAASVDASDSRNTTTWHDTDVLSPLPDVTSSSLLPTFQRRLNTVLFTRSYARVTILSRGVTRVSFVFLCSVLAVFWLYAIIISSFVMMMMMMMRRRRRILGTVLHAQHITAALSLQTFQKRLQTFLSRFTIIIRTP